MVVTEVTQPAVVGGREEMTVVLEQARLVLEEVVPAREGVMVVAPGELGLVQEEVVWPS